MFATGQFNQRISLEAPDPVEDALGQTATTWQPVATVWAAVRETPGREFLRGDYQAEERTAFVIRWRNGIDSTLRVNWRRRTYRIVSVTGTFRDRELWLHAIATEGPN